MRQRDTCALGIPDREAADPAQRAVDGEAGDGVRGVDRHELVAGDRTRRHHEVAEQGLHRLITRGVGELGPPGR